MRFYAEIPIDFVTAYILTEKQNIWQFEQWGLTLNIANDCFDCIMYNDESKLKFLILKPEPEQNPALRMENPAPEPTKKVQFRNCDFTWNIVLYRLSYSILYYTYF